MSTSAQAGAERRALGAAMDAVDGHVGTLTWADRPAGWTDGLRTAWGS